MAIIFLYLAILAVLFFVLVVRPQRRRIAARQMLIQSLEVGDEIVTVGGIFGTITTIQAETMRIEIADGVEITVAREAVASRRGDEITPPEPSAGSGDS
ncbi:MAG: preprotein translocase subunit YajC [Actinobacteria bacterium]|nr:preprotein translocase subunit YajC [Actinomycetota bacterium]